MATATAASGCFDVDCYDTTSTEDRVVPPEVAHPLELADASCDGVRVPEASDAAVGSSESCRQPDADAAPPSDEPPTRSSDGGTLIAEWLARPCKESCAFYFSGTQSCEPPALGSDGRYHLTCTYKTNRCDGMKLPGGRKPPGFSPRPANGHHLANFFSDLAQLEEASVPAFHALRRDLATHGAPTALVDAAAQAADDEVRHTKIATALARAQGARPPRPSVPHIAPRSLEEMAIENAVEGCVNETYGAVVATWISQRASDARTRAAMAVIAHDETGHAALAWEIAGWIDARLEEGARIRVRMARDGALRALAMEATRAAPRALIDAGVMPAPEEAHAMLATLGRHLWAA